MEIMFLTRMEIFNHCFLQGLLNGPLLYYLFQGAKLESHILQDNDFLLLHLRGFLAPVSAGSHSHWKLCYRASSHGWAASAFHSRCDGKPHTVSIIRKYPYVFGGYTDIAWGKMQFYHGFFYFHS